MSDYKSDIAFSKSVKKYQEKEGSRAIYQGMSERGDWQDSITGPLRLFIAQRDSFYMASVNEEGQPYVQHRGGPAGFMRVLNNKTLGFADFSERSFPVFRS